MTVPVLPVPAVEWKVKAASVGAYLAGVVGMAILQAVADGSLLASLPEPYATLLAPLLPAAVAFVSGYLTQHTPRSSGLGDEVDALVTQRAQEAVNAALREAETKLRAGDRGAETAAEVAGHHVGGGR